jgi:enoyl-CoA hydratase/carnithine racemase
VNAAHSQVVPMYQDIVYSVEDPVAMITLNRPSRLNAWTPLMDVELRDAVQRAGADRSVVGIVITGAGRGFCSGADVDRLQAIQAAGGMDGSDLPGPRSPERPSVDFDGRFTWLLATTKPIIAAINGPVAGMGVALALCCDIRFMAEDASLFTAFAQRGLIAEWGISWLLPRIVGPAHALELLFSSRRVSGREAEALGLVHRAVPMEMVLPHSIGYIRNLADQCSPASLSVMKRQVYEHLTVTLGAAERESSRLMADSFARPDFREGVQAYLDRRPPCFERLGSEEVDSV